MANRKERTRRRRSDALQQRILRHSYLLGREAGSNAPWNINKVFGKMGPINPMVPVESISDAIRKLRESWLPVPEDFLPVIDDAIPYEPWVKRLDKMDRLARSDCTFGLTLTFDDSKAWEESRAALGGLVAKREPEGNQGQ